MLSNVWTGKWLLFFWNGLERRPLLETEQGDKGNCNVNVSTREAETMGRLFCFTDVTMRQCGRRPQGTFLWDGSIPGTTSKLPAKKDATPRPRENGGQGSYLEGAKKKCSGTLEGASCTLLGSAHPARADQQAASKQFAYKFPCVLDMPFAKQWKQV
ncbi:uncharacterized protein CLUP02_14974 [Colletotrichum lupini]|uniref:Uncharacterized protein n=1 Tax=Colletotrichum lupini TaxID=145971 RepID=A0A9Q8T578_9PEZI|nr:uncharacterized protein CLUP02_14974 [Colletotrichum lupini]UQC89443.1 hypothetical protein CLUP02_14974 [Colletotrichum lupini]